MGYSPTPRCSAKRQHTRLARTHTDQGASPAIRMRPPRRRRGTKKNRGLISSGRDGDPPASHLQTNVVSGTVWPMMAGTSWPPVSGTSLADAAWCIVTRLMTLA